MNFSFFSSLSLWGVFVLSITTIFLSIYVGLWMGRWLSFKPGLKPSTDEAPSIGLVVGAMFGLLVFMLALTFCSATTRFDDSKQQLLNEVNAIGTAYLRADFLETEDRQVSQTLLRDYVQIRASILAEAVSISHQMMLSEAIQKKLWAIAVTYPKGSVGAPLTASYVAALNEVFDAHTAKVMGISYHVHPMIWTILMLVSALSMAALGVQFGQSGGRKAAISRLKAPISLLLATTLSLVLLLIADLDRPAEGMIQVNQSPMVTLLRSIQPPLSE